MRRQAPTTTIKLQESKSSSIRLAVIICRLYVAVAKQLKIEMANSLYSGNQNTSHYRIIIQILQP